MTRTPLNPEQESQLIAESKKLLLIAGEWSKSADGKTFPVEDPSTGDELCRVSDAGPRDARHALDSASAAQAGWAAVAPRERAEILRKAYELIVAHQEDLALLITLENGKPLAEARGEVLYGADFFRWFSEEAVRIDGRYNTAPNGQGRYIVLKQPVGPCLFITPWNFPIAMGCRKIAPAAAAGCTMVVKPAEQTPISMLALADLLTEAGFPAGVLNVLPTSNPGPVVDAIIDDPRLRKLSFTGSTEVGKDLFRKSAGNLLKLSMELGGNAPFIVFDDADIEQAVAGAIIAKMRNAGQACVAANRFYVHESVAERFISGLSDQMSKMRVGRGTQRSVQVGPLIDASGQRKVNDLVADAIQRGARTAAAPAQVADRGYFTPPVVLIDLAPDSRLLHEEIFGPVAPVVIFKTDEEAITSANNTPNGLVSYFYSQNLSRCIKTAEALEAGMVGVNRGFVSDASAPFGGIKHSGFGREGGREGIEDYLEVKYVALSI